MWTYGNDFHSSQKDQPMRYTLLLHYPQATAEEIGREAIEAGMAAFNAYAKALDDAGVLMSAEVLRPVASSTTLTMKNGTLQIQDGPYADTKEQLGGTFVLEVPDLDAALAWAEKCPAAQWGTVEIRPTAVRYTGGAWVQGG
jgi:hypothetical protein